MNYFIKKLTDIYNELNTDPVRGLTNEQVSEIQNTKGLNKFDEEKKETLIKRIAHHLTDLTSIILLIAAAVSFILAIAESGDFAETIVILVIVTVNTILVIYQESNAEKALESLKNMYTQKTVVIREGKKQSIDAVELVPGDILALEAGDMVSADARIIEGVNLKVDESVLTGESVPVEKDAEAEISDTAVLGDRLNMLYSGTLLTYGRAQAVVVTTGMQTEMGRISGMLSSTGRVKTPLQKRMVKLAKLITMIAAVSAVVLFAVQLISGDDILHVLFNAVALLVAAIPEMLLVSITIGLAFGVRIMARKNAVIRNIASVETMGGISVICSDKTGTLTMNRMSVKKIWAVGNDPKDANDEFGHSERQLLEIMGLACNASITVSEDGAEKAVGDPTETAIVRLLHDKHMTKDSLDAIFPKVLEIPFDSERKMMTTVHKMDDLEDKAKYISITKGAFDRLPIDAATVCGETAKRVHDQFADNALRVIAVAYKYYNELPENPDAEELEKELTFGGLVGMIDPPRPESAASVRIAKEAGIKTVMITGDHALTASAIAREIGILSEGEKAITGEELAEMPDTEFMENVRNYSVYARVSPEDKIRIVKAWQSHGEVVAMTGDGVNDAPALKAADVGIAMGIAGTDVSKNASDVVLADDNFATIVDAVEEGRRVYDNIRKTLFSLISDNFAEITVILFGVIAGWGMILLPLQLLFINIVADGIPDIFFVYESAERDIMKRKPIDRKSGVFANGLGKRTGMMTFVLVVATLAAYFVGRFVEIPGSNIVPSMETGVCMAFIINAWSSIINSFNIRSYKDSLFKIGFKTNRMLSYGILCSVGLTAIVATNPVLAKIFSCVPLSVYHWMILVFLGILPLIVGEIHKIAMNKWGNREYLF
jgi:calcium-translocating P-type ATPase